MRYIVCIAVIFWYCFNVGADNATKWKDYGFGVEIRTRTEKRVYKGKEPLSFFIDIRNKSKKSYFLVNKDAVLEELQFFSVVSSKGEHVPYSIRAMQRLNCYAPGVVYGGTRARAYRHDISPGATKSLKVVKDLRSLVRFNEKGEYWLEMTIFLYETKTKSKERRNVIVLRTPKLSFELTEIESSESKQTQDLSEKLIDIEVPQKPPVFGLAIKRIRINRTVLQGREATGTDKTKNGEVIVDIENVSKDKYPSFQWFGRYNTALWYCKASQNGKKADYGLFYGVRHHLYYEGNHYRYWYEVIPPGGTRQIKIPVNLNKLPVVKIVQGKDGVKYGIRDGNWNFKFSRSVFFGKNKTGSNFVRRDKLRKKTLTLPDVSFKVEGCIKGIISSSLKPMKKPEKIEIDE